MYIYCLVAQLHTLHLNDTSVGMSKRSAPQPQVRGKRPKGIAVASSQLIDDDDETEIVVQPKEVRYTHVISAVAAGGSTTYRTVFSTAPASPVKKPVRSYDDSAFDFTGALFGSVTEPPVTHHSYTSFHAAFDEEFPNSNPKEKGKRVRHLQVCKFIYAR